MEGGGFREWDKFIIHVKHLVTLSRIADDEDVKKQFTTRQITYTVASFALLDDNKKRAS